MKMLGDIAYKIMTKNNSKGISCVFTNSAEYGIINQSDYFDRDIANAENLQGYYIVNPNDFVYNPRISTSAPVGPINRNKQNVTGVMSPLYFVFRFKEGYLDYAFLDFFFKSRVWHGYMYQNGNNGARSDRFSINDDIFMLLPIAFPQSNDEQKEIGFFLQNFDAIISATETKLSKVRTMKQSLLRKMFV